MKEVDVMNIIEMEKNEQFNDFWIIFDEYITELAKNATNGDPIDLEYFASSEYRDAIESIFRREENPIMIHKVLSNDEMIGFSMCQLLYDEDMTCALMEFYLRNNYRGMGNGKKMYHELEKCIQSKKMHAIELTPTNQINEKFWMGVGYMATDRFDEDEKKIYEKKLL